LNLEELAAAGVRSFLFVAAPLKIRGATGAPMRPLALV
jgi:kynurenine formamidase